MFNAPASILAARALTGDQLRSAPPERQRRTAVTRARPAPEQAAPAAETPRRRRHGRGRLAWR